ncbi:methyl-coenzyme M reductase-associated protein Mmp3 [Methanolacinia petrolearia]|uniref:methyl-coenzyme M reductase-associated protein Mmp3 n=1 Tax=Methanolacinia petrolearia TaxID=54120 RepID=UPI00373AF576
MISLINIILDGKRMEMKDGSLLKDLVPQLSPNFSVAIIKPSESSEVTTGSFRIVTDEGEVTIELEDKRAPTAVRELLISLFEKKELLPMKIKWDDRYSASFGPFSSKIRPDKNAHRYSKGDLILGCGGYDPGNSYLIFSRADHIADHGSDKSGGIVGKVVSGLGVLGRWKKGSLITDSERIISRIETGNSFTTKDRSLPLEDGMEVVSRLEISATGFNEDAIDPTGSASVEHMLHALSKEKFEVNLKSSTFISDERLKDSIVPYEIKNPRLKGNVTVRTSGRKAGSVYIYLKDLPSSPSHTTTGRIEHGLELAKLASEGDRLHVVVTPPQIDLRGMRIKDAITAAKKREILIDYDDDSPDRIVVEQTPPTTMGILSEGKVSVRTVSEGHVINIRLEDEKAPRTCRIFRELTGLRWYNIGSLPLIFKYDDVALFKPKIPQKITINLENLPKDEVPANSLAITNDSRKGKGLIGIRRNPNREFGPTSEPFEGTNILGTVLDPEKLDSLKENETIYFKEESG